MSNRERWIIYPLLLFAFLMGARDKYVKPERVEFTSVTCRLLRIASMDGRTLATIGSSTDDAGVMVMYGPRESSGLPGSDSQIENARPAGHETVEISANEDGGYLRVFGTRPGFDLHFGHDGEQRFSGMAAIDEHKDYVMGEAEDAEKAEVWGLVKMWPELSAAADADDDSQASSE